MSRQFFITGLPRSRTAWFSAYLNAHPYVKCWHDGLNGCADPEHFVQKMKMYGTFSDHRIGNADSGLPLADIHAMFPDAPVVIIHRNFIDSVHSLMEALNLTNPTDALLDVLNTTKRRLTELNGLHVGFDEIDERMPDIMEWIGVDYDTFTHEHFRKMKITTKHLAGDPKTLEWLPFAQS